MQIYQQIIKRLREVFTYLAARRVLHRNFFMKYLILDLNRIQSIHNIKYAWHLECFRVFRTRHKDLAYLIYFWRSQNGEKGKLFVMILWHVSDIICIE